jgi:HTH-type transcriptional regulator/antitoxin HigA
MKPKVIKTEAEHEAALAYVETLMDAGKGSDEEADLELWSLLMERYEDERFPIEIPDPVTAIRFRMEQRGLTQADLSRLVGSKSRTSEVLGHRRPLSLNMIRALHVGLGIPTDILVQPIRLRSAVRSGLKRGLAGARKRRSSAKLSLAK